MNVEDWSYFALTVLGLVIFSTSTISLPQTGLNESIAIIEVVNGNPLIAAVSGFGMVCGFTGSILLKTKYTLKNPETKHEAYVGMVISIFPAITVLLYAGIALAVTYEPNFYLLVAYTAVFLYIVTSFVSAYIINYGHEQFSSDSKPPKNS